MRRLGGSRENFLEAAEAVFYHRELPLLRCVVGENRTGFERGKCPETFG